MGVGLGFSTADDQTKKWRFVSSVNNETGASGTETAQSNFSAFHLKKKNPRRHETFNML